MKILVADDHQVMRKGLIEILRGEYPNAAFGEAANSQEVLEQVWKESWNALILDVSMPGRSGLDILKELKKARPEMAVLVFSMHPEDQFAMRVLKAGADGYLTKESAPTALVGAMKKILSGGKYVSDKQAEQLAVRLEQPEELSPHQQLSDREFEVMRLIASGQTVSQIATQLSLSVKTISTYRSRILEKMRMQTNAELTHYAIKNGLA